MCIKFEQKLSEPSHNQIITKNVINYEQSNYSNKHFKALSFKQTKLYLLKKFVTHFQITLVPVSPASPARAFEFDFRNVFTTRKVLDILMFIFAKNRSSTQTLFYQVKTIASLKSHNSFHRIRQHRHMIAGSYVFLKTDTKMPINLKRS